MLRYVITDIGPGAAPDDLEALIDTFWRLFGFGMSDSKVLKRLRELHNVQPMASSDSIGIVVDGLCATISGRKLREMKNDAERLIYLDECLTTLKHIFSRRIDEISRDLRG